MIRRPPTGCRQKLIKSGRLFSRSVRRSRRKMGAAAAPHPVLTVPRGCRSPVSHLIGEPSFEQARSPKKKPRQSWGPAEAEVCYGIGTRAPTVGELGMMAVAVKQLNFAVTDRP